MPYLFKYLRFDHETDDKLVALKIFTCVSVVIELSAALDFSCGNMPFNLISIIGFSCNELLALLACSKFDCKLLFSSEKSSFSFFCQYSKPV